MEPVQVESARQIVVGAAPLATYRTGGLAKDTPFHQYRAIEQGQAPAMAMMLRGRSVSGACSLRLRISTQRRSLILLEQEARPHEKMSDGEKQRHRPSLLTWRFCLETASIMLSSLRLLCSEYLAMFYTGEEAWYSQNRWKPDDLYSQNG